MIKKTLDYTLLKPGDIVKDVVTEERFRVLRVFDFGREIEVKALDCERYRLAARAGFVFIGREEELPPQTATNRHAHVEGQTFLLGWVICKLCGENLRKID